MPRVRKTATGAPAQAKTPVAGQEYGAGVEQMALAEVMPTPQMRDPRQPEHPSPRTGNMNFPETPGEMTPVAAPQPLSIEELLAAARGQGAGAGMLLQDSRRPGEPVTAGLPIGSGPGPEALGFAIGSTPAGRFLRNLAQRTGRSQFAYLADQAGA